MAETALRTLALPEIAALKPYLVPELAVWAARASYFDRQALVLDHLGLSFTDFSAVRA